MIHVYIYTYTYIPIYGIYKDFETTQLPSALTMRKNLQNVHYLCHLLYRIIC